MFTCILLHFTCINTYNGITNTTIGFCYDLSLPVSIVLHDIKKIVLKRMKRNQAKQVYRNFYNKITSVDELCYWIYTYLTLTLTGCSIK